MSCTLTSSLRSCSFAADRYANLEAVAGFYAKMRAATAEAGRAGKLDAKIVAEDLALLDKKMMLTTQKMFALKPCLKV